ncbi:MAG: hypothetical protein PVF51_13790, partial [Nitrospirota bacterium]
MPIWLLMVPSSVIADGLDWLAGHDTADGSFVGATGVSTATQSTAEALRTFQALGQGDRPAIPAAR